MKYIDQENNLLFDVHSDQETETGNLNSENFIYRIINYNTIEETGIS